MKYKFCIPYLLLLSACSEQLDSPVVQQEETVEQNVVTFTHNVVASQQATRADETILNKGETSIETGKHVGIFGCYTGQNKWEDLVKLSKEEKETPTDDGTKTLKEYYTANQMYNVQATVGEGGTLTCSPQIFWPNNPLTADPSQHEYMTFWAYYPYNPTSSMGTYGIAITEETMGKGSGMGKVNFTMHPDASQQNDFLISAPVTDCNRDKYPLERVTNTPTYEPKPVPFRLYHMLAQVRIYAYIRGTDKMVYKENPATAADLTAATTKYFRKSDGLTSVVPEGGWLQEGDVVNSITITSDNINDYGDSKPAVMDQYGTWIELKVGDKVPDESQCVRWNRTDVWDVTHTRRRADINYTLEFNNVKTSASFYPVYDGDGKNATIGHDPAKTLGSATVNHYVMNPYWFTFQDGKRVRLNDNYMFGYYEDTPVANQFNATTKSTLHTATSAAGMSDYDDYDGKNWTGTDDPLAYLKYKGETEKNEIKGKNGKHYNFATGNILLMVPQKLNDDDVPNVVITATGPTTTNGTSGTATAKVTINMLKMGISWESGFIYCYAFLDELCPGDDKVRGPESITVLFNSNWYTDQW